MRDGWREVRVSDVADTLLGKTLKRDGANVDGGLPYLRNVNVQWGQISVDGLNTMLFTPAECETYALRKGDILVCEGGEVGRLALVREDLPGVYFQNALHRIRVREGTSARYVAIALEHLVRSGGLIGLVRQVTIAHLNQTLLRRLTIPLPPLVEQRRIVDLIAAVDDAIDAAEAEADTAAQVLARIRHQAFTVPTERKPAGELFDVAIGKQRSAAKADGDNVVPYLRSANVELGRIRVDDVLEMHFSEREIERLALMSGDVLVTEGSASEKAVGVPAVWCDEIDGVVGIQNALLRFRAVPGATIPSFTEHWVFWAYESGTFREIANGTNIKHVGVERAKLLPVVVLDEREQLAVTAVMDAARDATDIAQSTAGMLRALRSNLLTVLLSGEHEIPASYDHLLNDEGAAA